MLEPPIEKGVPAANEVDEKLWQFDANLRHGSVSKYRSELNLDSLGRCGNCQNLQCMVTTFGKIFARCEAFRIRIMAGDPPIECTYFYDVNTKPLSYYFAIGKEINVKKNPAGF